MELEVLSRFRIRVGGRWLAPGSAKQRSLLGLLALQPGTTVGYDEIAEVLWGPDPPASGRRLIHTHVARLRRLMEPGLPRPSAAKVLIGVRDGYRLSADNVRLDLARFDDLVRQAGQADGADALDLLDEALSCWGGRPLADLPTALHHHPAAVAAKGRWLQTVISHAELAMSTGAYARAADSLRAGTAAEPLHEGLHAQLMLALSGGGQQAAALAVFDEIRARLVDELGIEPGYLLREAQARVLHGTVPRREHGAPSWWQPAQLPPDAARFAGRAKELACLDGLLRAGEPVVVVTGMPGVGKTALALHWAHRIAGRFPDGHLHVNLRGYDQASPLEPGQALAGVLGALGVPPEQVPIEVDEAAALYRTLLNDRRLLVLLDNARDAEQVRPLLPGHTGSLVLVTSRDHLTGLIVTHGARRLDVEPLTQEDGLALLTRALDRDGDDVESAAAARLVQACGRLPLALRIAAATLAEHPEQSIGGYLDGLSSAGLLTGLAVAGDPQACVRIAFDHSYRDLPAAARRLFRLLGHVPGTGVRADAAAALADLPSDQAESLLHLLVSAHLVEKRGSGWYGLHDLLRLYAREQPLDEDAGAALARLMDWYVHTADAAAGLLYPGKVRLPTGPRPATAATFADEAEAVAWMEREQDNLVAAVRYAAAHGPRSAAWLLADTLRGYFWIRWPAPGWGTTVRNGLAAAAGAGDLRAQAACHLGLGTAHQAGEQYAQAVRHYTTALELARRAGWSDGTAEILYELGLARWWLGAPQDSADLLTDALALFQRTGRPAGQAAALLHLGVVQRHLGRLRSAATYQSRALAAYRRLGSRLGQAQALGNLGITYHELSRSNPASQRLDTALGLLERGQNRFDQAYFLCTMAAVHRDAGRLDAAVDAAVAAYGLACAIGHRPLEADTCNTLAGVRLATGDHRQALDLCGHALELTADSAFRAPRVSAWLGLAAAYQDAGRPADALKAARPALAAASADGFRLLEGRSWAAMAVAGHALGDARQALDDAGKALAVYRLTGHALGEAHMLSLIGSLVRDRDGADEALPYWRGAFGLYRGMGRPEAEGLKSLLRRPERHRSGRTG
ncbi:AfsR/SARP family transcriptional regulator [Nonomuraea longispora]|uniref:AfsR/SARP family transcriptional regulator n=1 Tax=Nonomuraea longispora TaxID=1848320 RepID=A0A4R4NCD2_9ACTN|nr:BTAD domain-containing putative transcriptional regulator [Nonomuraea longispora]TDC04282.1 AfsR/SARP family transcriptional regulator [Nonomuraea longispora]